MIKDINRAPVAKTVHYRYIGKRVLGKKLSEKKKSENKYQDKNYQFQTRQYKTIVYDKRNQLVYIILYWYIFIMKADIESVRCLFDLNKNYKQLVFYNHLQLIF